MSKVWRSYAQLVRAYGCKKGVSYYHIVGSLVGWHQFDGLTLKGGGLREPVDGS